MRSILECKKNKRGQIELMGNLLLSILFIVVVIGVVYIVGSKFLGTFEDNTSNEYNQTLAAFGTTDTVVDFLPILVIVSLAGLILYIVSRFGGQGQEAKA